LLPLRDIVVFPHMVVPLLVGRRRSISALERAMQEEGQEIVLAAQREPRTDEPVPGEIFEVGTLGTVIQLLPLADGTVKVLLEGISRVRLQDFQEGEGHYLVRVEEIETDPEGSLEEEALMRSLKSLFEIYMKLNRRIPPELLISVQSIEDPSQLTDTLAANLQLKLHQRQTLLEQGDPRERMEQLYPMMQGEIEMLQVEQRIRARVKRRLQQAQEESSAERQAPSCGDPQEEMLEELQALQGQIEAKEMSEEARERLHKEFRKLKLMPPMSAEATVVRHYIDWVLALPWTERTTNQVDLDRAQGVLDEDHYGLAKVKERILEHLAVQSLVERMQGPILCFAGPPGVGKTSLGRSIARATKRDFIRLSLGGVRDEAEIRGHRRTYVGAMPGKIIQSLKKAGTNNPVFLLDEVDKMSTDFRGDPSSALLEVLDPEQNSRFNDHYLDLDYDLSDVMFICTANNLEAIPPPLQDRMEIIRIPGYTDEEKLKIARRHLISKQQQANGLGEYPLHVSDGAVRTVISQYTHESGVRSLEREIAAICRKLARDVVCQRQSSSFRVNAKSVPKYLGMARFRHNVREEADEVGLANGLAVTMHGGELLATEVAVMAGQGKLVLTGKLGDVMQESAQAALSYLRSRAVSFGLEPDFNQQVDLHIHLPEGAIPKDGPSAGITMVTALASALMQIPVRRDVAMTGEITLRGRVLPIGGLKEKVLAAHRAGITRVIIPAENEKDLAEVPAAVRKGVSVSAVTHMDQVLRLALCLPDPTSFLAQPSEMVDWRMIQQSPSLSSH